MRHHDETSPSRVLASASGAIAAPMLTRIAWAQPYLERQCHHCRLSSRRRHRLYRASNRAVAAGEAWGVHSIANRPGATTNVTIETLARATADGYTLGMISTSGAIGTTLYDKFNFNLIADIAPIASINRVPYVMEANPSLPIKTIPEFVAYAKAHPGKVNMGSPIYWVGKCRSCSTLLPLRSRASRVASCGRWKNDRDTNGSVAARPAHRRLCAKLRGQRLE
jgi:hypothetical protein